jgi:hypothetical protein
MQNNSSDIRMVHEAHLLWAASDSVSLALESVLGSEQNVQVSGLPVGKANWSTGALYAMFRFSPTFTLAPRLETYQDEQGYTLGGGNQTLTSGTLTSSYLLDRGLESKFEIRYDKSSNDSAFSRHGVSVPDQTTFTVGLLYFPK